VRLLAALSLVLLGGCPQPGGGDDGPTAGECFVDEECRTSEVCARDDSCWPEAEVHRVMTTWTVRGQPASDTACARTKELFIRFESLDDHVGFSPVPCNIGQFVVDKLPRPFTRVKLGIYKDGPWRATSIASSGSAALDLPF